ncbi:hypothetical protein GOBAR_AA06841 [Gossypium barbadense]|uniref:Uncharacterized protein n=2 Tax=Gossypium TaxID=3633 RepID=A0A2P5YDW2_GOSBA|nr:hypothetical protein GOBAR_AA06841 [Gossypium barbadense]
MHLSQKPLTDQSFGYFMDELKVTGDQLDFPSAEFNYLLEALNINTTSDGKIKHVEKNNNDQESEGLNLPDSPFTSAIESGGISTII